MTAPRFTIRDLASPEDYASCVALQRETWGAQFNDTVPASILLVSQKLGGVAAGAFDDAGRLLGFVYGMTGVENKRVVHWSDMLAVRPEAQNAGIGRALKEFQRRQVAKVGADVIYWTFDPLVARNAYLNFTVFGVRAVQYVRDMYGANTGSELHRMGTDRLIVAWPVKDAALKKRRGEIARAELSNPVSQVLVEIPPDIVSLMRTDAEQAREWRRSSRGGLEMALATGHRLDGVRLAAGRVHYVLTKPKPRKTSTRKKAGRRS